MRTDDRRDPRPGRPGDPRPPARPVPVVRPGPDAARPARRRRPGRRAGCPRDVQPDLARPAAPPDRRPLRGRPRPRPGRQQRRPRPRRRGHRLDLVPGPHGGGPARGDRRGHDPPSRHVPRDPRPARDVPRPAAQARPGCPRRGRSAGSARTAPGATTAIPAAASGRRATTRAIGARREDRSRLPVHLPGGRRRRPARPVPVREPAPRRPRRPDHHREPRPAALVRGRHHPPRDRLLGADERVGRHADVLAALHRPGQPDAGRGAVRPAPLPRAVRAVPVAVPAARVHERQRGDVPRLRRLLAVVRARQPGHARPCGPAPRPRRGQRGRPPLHRPVLPGRLQGHPERRRRPALCERRPDRALAGRHAEHPVRRAARTAQGPAPPAEGPAHPAQGRLRHAIARRGFRATGTRSAAVRGHTGPPGRRVPRSRQRRGEGPAVPDRGHLRLARDRRRIVRDRAAGGDGRRARRSSPRTSTATRASSGAGARACSSRRATRRASPRRSCDCSTTRSCGPRWARPARPGPRTSAGRGSRPRSRSTTASSSAGWPRAAPCRPASVPRSLRRRRRSGPGRPHRCRPPRRRPATSALASRQDQVE